jgi:membrane protease YdiL (CAAX protease family)
MKKPDDEIRSSLFYLSLLIGICFFIPLPIFVKNFSSNYILFFLVEFALVLVLIYFKKLLSKSTPTIDFGILEGLAIFILAWIVLPPIIFIMGNKVIYIRIIARWIVLGIIFPILDIKSLNLRIGAKSKYYGISLLGGILMGVCAFYADEPMYLSSISWRYPFLCTTAIFEEVLFKGVLQQFATRTFKFGKAVLIQATIFTAIHGVLFMSTIKSPINIEWLEEGISLFALPLINLFIFGIFTGVIFWKSKSIGPCIVFHFITNIVLYGLKSGIWL